MGTDYDENKAAEILGIDLTQLRTKIKGYSLDSLIFTNRFFSENKKSGINLDQFLERLEADIIREALYRSNFIKQDSAKFLGISFRSLRYKVETYRIEDHPDKPRSGYMVNFQIESLNDYIKNLEKEIITEALKSTGYNKTEAAGLLGISFRSLRYRVGQHGIY